MVIFLLPISSSLGSLISTRDWSGRGHEFIGRMRHKETIRQEELWWAVGVDREGQDIFNGRKFSGENESMEWV